MVTSYRVDAVSRKRRDNNESFCSANSDETDSPTTEVKMKFRINKGGCLEISRAGQWFAMFCPFTDTDAKNEHCGDWCAMFGEPEERDAPVGPEYKGAMTCSLVRNVELPLCAKTLSCARENFVDERIHHDN